MRCREQFWIYDDIINSPYELFVFGATEYLRSKRYMLYVHSLAQAWEIFFSTFAYSNYLYRPFSASAPFGRDHEQFDRLSARLDDAIGKFAFKALRNVLINTVLKRVHPQTLQESEVAIPRVVAEGFDNDPKKADIEKFPDEKVRDLLERIRSLKVGDLRNKVVHHRAHRPRLAEVEECRREVNEVLYTDAPDSVACRAGRTP